MRSQLVNLAHRRALSRQMLGGLLPVVFALLAGLILARGVKQRNRLVAHVACSRHGPRCHVLDLLSKPQRRTRSDIADVLAAVMVFRRSWLLLIFPVFFILLLFPTGKPVSPRWRWVTMYALLVCLLFFVLIGFARSAGRVELGWVVQNPAGFVDEAWLERVGWAPFVVGLLSVTLLSVASVFARYRRALAIEREQIKWVLFACGIFAAVYLGQIVFNLLGVFDQGWASAQWWYLLGPLSLMTIPIAIAIAILRYRLFDIDVIIRKTLVYAALTALLALVYFGSVVLLQRLFGRLTGVAAVAAGGGRLDAGHRRAVHAAAPPHPGRHRPALLPQEVRRAAGAGAVRAHRPRRDRPGRADRGAGACGAGDVAAGGGERVVEGSLIVSREA